jgi:plastocyanin
MLRLSPGQHETRNETAVPVTLRYVPDDRASAPDEIEAIIAGYVPCRMHELGSLSYPRLPRSVRALRRSLLLGFLVGVSAFVPVAQAQSLLDRPDNVSADWVGATGTLYFNFIHRFSSSPPPERKVSNFPTFLIATGLGSRALVGVNYATNSALVPRYPNEYELFGRYALWQQYDGRPVDIGGQVDYNVSVRGVDGELSIARRQGPVRVIAVGRVLADTVQGGPTRLAFGGGGTLRLFRYVALAGDAVRMSGDGNEVVWSAGVHIALPNTPHTLSIHASNANTATLQGLSRGGGVRRYGFEFTIPVTLSRFFHPDAAPPPPTPDATAGAATSPAVPAAAAAPAEARRPDLTPAEPASTPPVSSTPPSVPATAAAPATKAVASDTVDSTRAPQTKAPREPSRPVQKSAPRTVNARITSLAYVPSRIEIAVGTTVQWKNNDPLIHTVTANDGSFKSPQFGLDGTYRHTFTKPGTYSYYCILHPNMKATVVVK